MYNCLMDNRQRHVMKMVKYRRRLKNLGLKEVDGHHAYRESGKPCSCSCCSPHRYEGPRHSDMKRSSPDL